MIVNSFLYPFTAHFCTAKTGHLRCCVYAALACVSDGSEIVVAVAQRDSTTGRSPACFQVHQDCVSSRSDSLSRSLVCFILHHGQLQSLSTLFSVTDLVERCVVAHHSTTSCTLHTRTNMCDNISTTHSCTTWYLETLTLEFMCVNVRTWDSRCSFFIAPNDCWVDFSVRRQLQIPALE